VGCGRPEPDELPNRLKLGPRDGLELVEEGGGGAPADGDRVSDLGLRRPTLDDVFLRSRARRRSEDGGPPPRPLPRDGGNDQSGPAIRLPSPQALRGDGTDAPW